MEINRRKFLFAAAFAVASKEIIVKEVHASCQTGRIWEGTASYYSRAGCLGCSPNMIMANGEPLDDSRLTLAFMRTALNVPVLVTNIENGLSTIATVTDRGGFEPYGRIADLSEATKDAIGGGGLTTVKITELDCT